MPESHYQQFLNHNPYPRELIEYQLEASAAVEIQRRGQVLINFSSNDYLGLSKHPEVIAQSQQYAKQYGVGLGSSRLVAAPNALFQPLEMKLAHYLNKPAVLILGTGYQTNATVLEALLDPTVLKQDPIVFLDKYCHASMIHCQHYATIKRFRHNDLDHLEQLLAKEAETRPKFILAESIYSMEGDRLRFEKITALAAQYHAFLYIDDAHSIGVEGINGFGQASHHAEGIDVIMGTFSKAFGSLGGYVACSNLVKEYLVNKCRGLIYSTALPAPVLGAIHAAIELIPQLDDHRQKINHHAQQLRLFFQKNHLNCGVSESHIVPWIIGDENKTLRASALLREQGILGVTIRPPSVPRHQSRIRFCMTSMHNEGHVERLMTAIIKTAEIIL